MGIPTYMKKKTESRRVLFDPATSEWFAAPDEGLVPYIDETSARRAAGERGQTDVVTALVVVALLVLLILALTNHL